MYSTEDSLPPVPSIRKGDNDSFAVVMTKMLMRSLLYRFDTMPEKMKEEVLAFYRANTPSYESMEDSTLLSSELGSIVMQMVSVILSKNDHGELWVSKPNTEGRKTELMWSKEERLKQWVRSLDSNLLSCDDTKIIQMILMKAGSVPLCHP